MEVAVAADEVLGADGRIGIHRVRAEVLDGESHVSAVRIDDSAAESAEGLRLVVHSETVPARSDSVAGGAGRLLRGSPNELGGVFDGAVGDWDAGELDVSGGTLLKHRVRLRRAVEFVEAD